MIAFHLPDVPAWAVGVSNAAVAALVHQRARIRAALAHLPTLLVKGATTTMATTLTLNPQLAVDVLEVVGLAVLEAEVALGAGTGADKKARAVATLQAQLPTIAAAFGVSQAVVGFVCNASILGGFIDGVVAAFNAAGGLFNKAVAQ